MSKKLILAFSLVMSLSFTNFLMAQTNTQKEITIKDLGIDNPGILPSSPFYFLKEWTRGINKILTFNPVKKAELELKETNERAAEIKKLEEINPQNIEAISKAIEKYNINTDSLKNRLEALKETSQNPNVNKLLDNLVNRLFEHQQLFDDLKLKFEDQTKLEEELKNGQEKINEIISVIPQKFEDSAIFEQRLERGVQNMPEGIFKELRGAEIIGRIKENLPFEQQGKIQELKDKLIGEFQNRIEKLGEAERINVLTPEILKGLPGDQLKRIQILDQVQEGLTSSTIQEKFKEIKAQILDQETKKNEITERAVEEMIQETKEIISKAEAEVQILDRDNGVSDLSAKIKELSGQVEIHLGKAANALNEGKIGEAFGRATSAVAIAKKAWQIVQFSENSINSIKPIPNVIEEGTTPETKEDRICIQVITPAVSPGGVCKEFSTPCDVPLNWKKIDKCPAATSTN